MYLMLFWHKRKINNFDPYNVFLAIATNIPQRLKTGFVVQGHIWDEGMTAAGDEAETSTSSARRLWLFNFFYYY